MAALDEARLAATAEEALEPELEIIDPHHHFWDFPTHRYLLDELLADTGSGHNIIATVFIECAVFYRRGAEPGLEVVGEVEAANGLAAMAASGRYGATLAAAGIVGTADLTRGAAVEEVLRAQIEVGGGRFKGIRHAAGWEDRTASVHNSHSKPPRYLYRDHVGFREGFAKLGELGLSFDAWLYHPQLGDLVDLARSFPEQPIILNHVGGPLGVECYAERRDEVFAEWSASMRALSGCPNVTVKLGGMGMALNGFAFDKRPTAPSSQELADAWRGYVETVIETFGPDRCMFESNFPVDKISGSYVNYWNAFKRLAAGASESEKAALFRETARRVYRL
ncbi:MAG: amidohydrolase family protein [Candidatus Latescibacteria bacterium]|nr:amidohydrolase family protein [Candidatus Latescibacterota bacterium]